jgi:hypothetical protein
MSYAPSDTDLFRRAASYVDTVLKGANPADLPIEQPTKFELIINLKTRKRVLRDDDRGELHGQSDGLEITHQT